jgi:basic membrane lipoprotein Med (substrate-binding protein (PBP1-ABC) superfamily)
MKISAKNYIKRLIAVLLSLMLLMSVSVLLTGCGDDDNGGDGGEQTDEPAVEEDEEPRPVRVGFVYSGGIEGSVHNAMWESSRLNLERQLGAETFYVENVFLSNFNDAVTMLVSLGVDAIVSTSHFFANAVESAATDNKEVVFISFGGQTLATNITTFQPYLFQPAHVAGLAAAYNTGVDVRDIGVVVDPRMYNVNGVINSFIQGAKISYISGVRVHIRYVYSQDESQVRAALEQLRDEGADTVLSYLDTEYAITNAERMGMNVVGYANNIAELARNHHVTGFFLNVNSYLTEKISMIENDNFFPVQTRAGMDTGCIRLAPLNTNEDTVNPATAELTEPLQELVVNGSAPIFVGELIDNHAAVQVPNGASLTAQEIIDMNWLERSVGANFVSLVEPRSEVPVVPLTVVFGEIAEAARQAARREAAEEAQDAQESE